MTIFLKRSLLSFTSLKTASCAPKSLIILRFDTRSKKCPAKPYRIVECFLFNVSAPIPTKTINKGINGAPISNNRAHSQLSVAITHKIYNGEIIANVCCGQHLEKYPSIASIFSINCEVNTPAEVFLREAE
jgi:hypothetical protein